MEALEFNIQNFNVISFIHFAKIKYKEILVNRDDQLELLFNVECHLRGGKFRQHYLVRLCQIISQNSMIFP